MSDPTYIPKIQSALKVLRDFTPGELLTALTSEHRTHQQSTIRAIVSLLRLYATAPHDLRNEASVAFCQFLVNELDNNSDFPQAFPFI